MRYRSIIEIIIEKFILQQVQCFPLYSVLQALDNPKVDYFSLDIEGAEYPVRCNSKFSTFDIVKSYQKVISVSVICILQVLKSVPWDKVDIRVLGVEIAHTGAVFDGTTEDIVKLLEDQNYVYKVVNTELYMHIYI